MQKCRLLKRTKLINFFIIVLLSVFLAVPSIAMHLKLSPEEIA